MIVAALLGIEAVAVLMYTRGRSKQLVVRKQEIGGVESRSGRLRDLAAAAQTEISRIKDDAAAAQARQERLSRSIESVSADRDNLRVQVTRKTLDPQALAGYNASLDKLRRHQEIIARQKAERLNRLAQLRREIEELSASHADTRKQSGIVQGEKDALLEKLSTMQKDGYAAWLTERNTMLSAELEKMRIRFQESYAVLENEKSSRNKLQEEEKAFQEQAEEFNREYERMMRENTSTEDRLMDGPAYMAAVARQNKALTRRLAMLHYNLGVHYLKYKQYKHAVHEFESALRLEPSDARIYFNLGYIHAECIVDSQKAVRYFKQYARYADPGDPDLNWARNYIATWSSWGGKEPMR